MQRAALRRGEHPVAPAFDLERLDRAGQLDLESLRGKAVVLNFWASWCLPVQEGGAAARAGVEAVASRRAWWSSASTRTTSRRDARRFTRRYALSYPIVHDGPGRLLDDYGLDGFPETFFIRPDGRLASVVAGRAEQARRSSAGIREALSS